MASKSQPKTPGAPRADALNQFASSLGSGAPSLGGPTPPAMTNMNGERSTGYPSPYARADRPDAAPDYYSKMTPDTNTYAPGGPMAQANGGIGGSMYSTPMSPASTAGSTLFGNLGKLGAAISQTPGPMPQQSGMPQTLGDMFQARGDIMKPPVTPVRSSPMPMKPPTAQPPVRAILRKPQPIKRTGKFA